MKLTALLTAAAAAASAATLTAFADIGDVNADNSINISDVVVTAAHVKGVRSLSGDALTNADVNGDSKVNITDVVTLAAHVKGIQPLDGKSSYVEPEPEPQDPTIEVKNGVTYVNGILIANKTYSLPENYGSGLTDETLNAFYKMQAGAWQDGISLWICSGFRSYWDQYYLYNNYVARDGKTEADTYSARPGHSEHQTGLAMDLNNASRSFYGTREAAWIAAHCAEYGFIIRYPQGKENITGFIYEPWHVRYVGKDLARKITDSGLCLEEYLGIDSYYHY